MTREMEMLETSRDELRRDCEDKRGAFETAWCWIGSLNECVVEIVGTGFRFLHLVVIFVPVIAAVPIIWFGRSLKDRDNERTGTLLWYRFLVWAMERAGPAFIKVRAYDLLGRLLCQWQANCDFAADE